MCRLLCAIAACFFAHAAVGSAMSFGNGWTLEGNASSLAFTSGVTGAEAPAQTSVFRTLQGEIGPDGASQFAISLDSVDTGNDLQDARLRFLLFESFRLKDARVSSQIDPDVLVGLNQGGQKTVKLPITLQMNAVSVDLDTTLNIVAISDEIVSVSTTTPISLGLADFNFLPGLARLEQAAGVKILPTTDVTFELLFKAVPAPVLAPTAASTPDAAILQACADQIATIAQSDQVYFTSGSNALEPKSFPLLDAVVDTLQSCPTILLRIEGHTDDVGDARYNTGLSIARAAEVVTYLATKGVAAERLGATGFGEDHPIADNDTERGRWKNRRIEFIVPGFTPKAP